MGVFVKDAVGLGFRGSFAKVGQFFGVPVISPKP